MATVRVVLVLWATLACAAGTDAQRATDPVPSSWPPPLEIRGPFEPTAFKSASRTYLTYELHLRNFATNPVTLSRVEVLDADTAGAEPIAAFEAQQLDTLLQPVGVQAGAGASDAHRQLAAGGSIILFVSIAFEQGARVPTTLRHRVHTSEYVAEGAVIGTHHTELRVLGPPLTGAEWRVGSGPSNDSYHRRGILVFDGRALISRRYAIDWTQMDKGATFSGDDLDPRSYHAYGEEVLAVVDGRVVSAQDGIPENVPRHQGFRPAVPISLDTVAGNTITLDVGGGQFAYYMHLQPGS
ncbi:MAG: M23 family peptidase, partial [Actinomycetota bacterium]|nr:M23 family peptidase [Actinomycetota bacterium]